MGADSMHFEVPSKHTAEMVEGELDAMLGAGRMKLCLGHVMRLARMHSPYIFGGHVDETALAMAMSLWPHDAGHVPDPVKFHQDLVWELDAAFRPMELYDKTKNKDSGGEKSDVRPFSPEWMADVMCSACHAMPSLGYREILWETPLCLVMHLRLAESRANGAVTARPMDYKAAFAMMRRMRENKEENNG